MKPLKIPHKCSILDLDVYDDGYRCNVCNKEFGVGGEPK